MSAETPAKMPDPHTIYQDWLDITSAALMDGNTDIFVEKLHLPFILRSIDGETVLETAHDVRSDTRNALESLKSLEVTHYIRLVKQARYLDEDTIEGWHSTYVLRNATAVTPTYSSRMMMRCIDGVWQVTEAEHEVAGTRFPVSFMRATPGSFEHIWADAKADIRATQARAEPIYQVFLDTLSDATNAQDFDTWAGHFLYPLAVHYIASDHTMHEREDMRAFFDVLIDQMQTVGANRMIRHVRFAEFLADDRIIGYHETLMTKDGETVFDPVKSRMMLTLEEGRWKCSSVTNSLSHNPPTKGELCPTPELPTVREIQERMRK